MTKQNPNNKTLRLAATAVSVLALCGTAQAQLYWDSNNSTAGFGTAGGTWAAPTTNSASQGWSSSSTGSTALSGTTTTNTTSALNFGTSTNQLGTGTITVSGSVEANSLTFVSSGGSNNTTLSGGNITLGGTTPSITVTNIANTAATHQIIASNIILGANQTWTVNSGGATGIATLSASGRISGGFGITKSGNGNLNLNGNNTYTGGTAINAGRLDIRNANALGTGNVTIASGAFAGVQTASTISNNFIIAGNGTGNGVIQSYANNTVAGLVTLSDNAMIGARTSAGNSTFTLTGGITSNGTDRTLTLNTFGSATIATNQLTISTNSVNLGTGGILDIGHGMNAGGTATFNINVGSNTWGTTIVRGLATAAASTNATLNLGAVNALGSSSSVLQLGSLNTALEGITVNLNGNSQTIGGLRSFGSTGSASANGTRTVTSATAATLTIDNSSGTNYLYDGVITGAISLTKNGNATQTLSGTNTYSGTTTINQGVLNITSNSTLPGLSTNGRYSVANGATLAVSNAVTDADIASMLGTTNFADGAAIGFDTSSGTRTYSSNLTVTSQGALGLTKLGSNYLTLTGNNSYTGTTTINGGTLRFIGNATHTLSGLITGSGNLEQGNGSAGNARDMTITNDANDFTGQFRADGGHGSRLIFTSIADYGTASALGRGTAGTAIGLSNGFLVYTGTSNSTSNRTWAGVNSNQIQNNSASGVLTLSGNYSHSTTNGTLTLSGSNTGANTFGGRISAAASGVGSLLNLTKAGAGTWILSGNNTYTGNTTVTLGALNISHSNALGVAGALGSSGTTVSSGAALQMQGDITVGAEALSLTGTGISATGALRNISGSNTYGGAITLAGVTRINSDAGLLTLSGGISGDARNLTIGGAGDTTISNAIATTTGTLTKDGAGTLILSGNNSYSGLTTVSQGTLAVNGSVAGAVAVNSSATLQGSGSIGGALSVSGQLSPGNSIESIGASSVSFLNGSTYDYELDSSVLGGDLLYTTGALNIASTTTLSLTELASGTLAMNGKLTLISYGTWNGGLFTYNGNTLNNGDKFTLGSNEWLFKYDDTSGGNNFLSDQAGASKYITMTVVPEPNVAMMVGSLALMTLLRRRRD